MAKKSITENTVFNSLISYNVKLDKTIEPQCNVMFTPQSQEKIFISQSLREKLENDNKLGTYEIDDLIYIFEGFEKFSSINMEMVGCIFVFTQNVGQEKIWIKLENKYRGNNNGNSFIDVYFNYDTKINIIRQLRKGTLLKKLNSPINVFISKYITPVTIVTASLCIACIITIAMFKNKTKM